MAYGRCTPMRDEPYEMVNGRYTPMRWPMGEACLRDGPCEKHVYERHVYERPPTGWPYGGLPGVYSIIWGLCYKTNKLKKERRWGVERGSAGLSRSTRRDITWPNRRSYLRSGKYPLYHLGGITYVLALYAGKRRCLRHCWRLGRAPAHHTFPGNHI
jgi:hypothetical protein